MGYEIIASLAIGLVIGVASVWVAISTSTNKLNTCMQLQTQILNNQAETLKQIHDDARGTYKTVEKTHARVGRIENVQTCQGEEHDQHARELSETRKSVQDMPAKIKALLT